MKRRAHGETESLDDKIKWNRSMAETVDPLGFYAEHYAGLSRGQLQKADQSLYRTLWEEGLLENVPLLRAERRDFGKSPLAYYRAHYKGMTRGVLRQEDPSLYEVMRRDGLLKYVPKK